MFITIVIISMSNHFFNYSNKITDEGLELLNDYEFPVYLIETNDDNQQCMNPYSVGDGKITFGPGIAYQNKQEGLDDMNHLLNTNYTINDSCILVDDLYEVQKEKLTYYEGIVNDFAFDIRLKLTPNQFDALVLMSYNSPALFSDEGFIQTMENNQVTKEEYIISMNSYYQTLDNYYDNLSTDESGDGFGAGWYNRIEDSADVYFDSQYDYQI